MNKEKLDILRKVLSYHVGIMYNGHAEGLKDFEVEKLQEIVTELERRPKITIELTDDETVECEYVDFYKNEIAIMNFRGYMARPTPIESIKRIHAKEVTNE